MAMVLRIVCDYQTINVDFVRLKVLWQPVKQLFPIWHAIVANLRASGQRAERVLAHGIPVGR